MFNRELTTYGHLTGVYNSEKRELKLNQNKLVYKDLLCICDFLNHHEEIKSLNLAYSDIDDWTVRLIKCNYITSMNLMGNAIGNNGAKALANNKTITSLNLSCNRIGNEGATALASNKNIIELDLRANFAINLQIKQELSEKNPIKQANYGRNPNHGSTQNAPCYPTNVPSLLNISLFTVKNRVHAEKNFKQQVDEKLTENLKELMNKERTIHL